ncbi:expressed unknown protein [Seminavis robusta]|uniref:Uncharacterized protein n=1 Tax=Seminavis robusta TaxID=568900 RepID=A0A9N8EN98_9STRA|nr:expressed unknown protein [Seminavis robusta]|eukprot:Sro1458_g274380.1 n/a (183) ;mRNA; f:4281-4950
MMQSLEEKKESQIQEQLKLAKDTAIELSELLPGKWNKLSMKIRIRACMTEGGGSFCIKTRMLCHEVAGIVDVFAPDEFSNNRATEESSEPKKEREDRNLSNKAVFEQATILKTIINSIDFPKDRKWPWDDSITNDDAASSRSIFRNSSGTADHEDRVIAPTASGGTMSKLGGSEARSDGQYH